MTTNTPTRPSLLMLSACPRGQARLRLSAEHNRLQDRLAPRGRAGLLRYRPEARLTELMQVLQDNRDIQILHFCGHAETRGLVFEDEFGCHQFAAPLAIAETIAGFNHIQGVFVNACHTAQIAELLSVKVHWSIGMNGVISDAFAIEFSEMFYVELMDSNDVKSAFITACAAIAIGDVEGSQIPRLYLDGHPYERPPRQRAKTPRARTQQASIPFNKIGVELDYHGLIDESTGEFIDRLLKARRVIRNKIMLGAKGDAAGAPYGGLSSSSGAATPVWPGYRDARIEFERLMTRLRTDAATSTTGADVDPPRRTDQPPRPNSLRSSATADEVPPPALARRPRSPVARAHLPTPVAWMVSVTLVAIVTFAGLDFMLLYSSFGAPALRAPAPGLLESSVPVHPPASIILPWATPRPAPAARPTRDGPHFGIAEDDGVEPAPLSGSG